MHRLILHYCAEQLRTALYKAVQDWRMWMSQINNSPASFSGAQGMILLLKPQLKKTQNFFALLLCIFAALNSSKSLVVSLPVSLLLVRNLSKETFTTVTVYPRLSLFDSLLCKHRLCD